MATTATITLPHWKRTIMMRLGPCEIKTLRIPLDEDEPIVETNLLEEDILKADVLQTNLLETAPIEINGRAQ